MPEFPISADFSPWRACASFRGDCRQLYSKQMSGWRVIDWSLLLFDDALMPAWSDDFVIDCRWCFTFDVNRPLRRRSFTTRRRLMLIEPEYWYYAMTSGACGIANAADGAYCKIDRHFWHSIGDATCIAWLSMPLSLSNVPIYRDFAICSTFMRLMIFIFAISRLMLYALLWMMRRWMRLHARCYYQSPGASLTHWAVLLARRQLWLIISGSFIIAREHDCDDIKALRLH